jgi:hypothetical protein
VTLCGFRSPGQVRNAALSKRAKRVLGAGTKRLSECFRTGEIFGLDTIGTAGTIGTGFFFAVRVRDTSSELNAISRFKAMEGLNPQIKRKILSDNPRRFYGI